MKKPMTILALLLITSAFMAEKTGAQPQVAKEKEPGVRLKLEAKKVLVKNQRLEGLTLIADGITFDISGMPPEPQIAGQAGPAISLSGPKTNAQIAPETVKVGDQVITKITMRGDDKQKVVLEVKRERLILLQATADEIIMETTSPTEPARQR